MTDSAQRYRVVEKLESGGMAEVFRAESEGLQGFRKQVAIKRVLPHLSSKKKFIQMFLDEARLSAQLSHSNCVQVFDIGVGDNAYFIVMEFVDGANLKSVVESLRKRNIEFPLECAVFIALEICKGLSYAHELTDSSGEPLHIVHRDISPPNVLLTKFGEIKIVDFGLAKANSQLEKSEPGIIKGKFSYLSPEAAMGQDVDARTDVFAVGIMLWELLAGQRLFLGDTDFQTVKKVQAAVVPDVMTLNKKVPADLQKIIAKSLARDPQQRYTTARELGIELSKFLFRFGTPVSTFDVAKLVINVMKEKQKTRAPQASIIDQLIAEALLEFTSLGEEKEGGGGGAGPLSFDGQGKLAQKAAVGKPGSKEYVDVGNWGDELSVPNHSSKDDDAMRVSLPHGLTEGNLAALEDDDLPIASSSKPVLVPQAPPTPKPSTPRAATPLPIPPSARSGAALPSAVAPRRDEPEAKKGNATVGVVVAVIVVAAAGAAAWFTNLIPHH
jgi:eukaryotic-like serine/threonine-protein kinase